MVFTALSSSPESGHSCSSGKHLKAKSTSSEIWESAMRREKQRLRMVNWRKAKKHKVSDMVHERRQLENVLQLRVKAARVASDGVSARSTAEAYRQVIIESAALTRENLALREFIGKHVKVEALMEREAQTFLTQIRPGDSPLPAETVANGWRVQFPNSEPSFYFHPFTKKEYDDVFSHFDFAYADSHPCSATVGEIFDWTVDYAPLAQNKSGTSFIAHARFSRRLCCTLDNSEKILPHLDRKLWPVLVTPRSWGRVQTGSVCCQALQSFNEDAHVMMGNIPGEVNLRYLVLARHTREKRSDGKRVDKYMLTIADSEPNKRNREAEGLQEDMQWVQEGRTYVTIMEVDESTIDVVFDQWAGCLSEMHSRELYIDWIRCPVQLEQDLSPTRLLRV